MDLGPGDWLWTSPITFVASANCARFCGANVDFVDIDESTGLLSVKALSDTREKVELTKNKLPEDADEPRIFEVNLSRFPVLAVAISGDVDERILNNYAKILRENLEMISEVLEV